ncbi:MAG: hypothetical protein OXI80_09305, partial [Caldilineaceae bacterium]|nr:hypothetical protein [Caldilineaceae bacterium]
SARDCKVRLDGPNQVNTYYEKILAHQDQLSAKATKTLWKRFEKLDIHIPDSRNTQFDKTDVLRMVLKMSQSKKKFSRSAAKRLKAEAFRQEQGGGKKWRAASSDWGMGKLAGMDPEHVGRWCDNTMRFMACRARNSRMIQSNTMVGIDLTMVPYYGSHLKDDMLKSKPLKGTSYFDAHMTTHSFGPAPF